MRALCSVLAVLMLAGCTIPQDPEGTLDRVEGGTMRVGVTSSEPWVTVEGESYAGVEVALVRRFAAELGAQIEWTTGSEEELVGALHERKLDLVIGGLTKKSPWKKQVALTRPYISTRIVVGFPPGAPSPPDDLKGLTVQVERGTEAEGLLDRKTDATPLAVETLERGRPAAADEFLLADLGLRESGTRLAKVKHVMAVVAGENAFQVRLERFLLDANPEVRRLLHEEADL